MTEPIEGEIVGHSPAVRLTDGGVMDLFAPGPEQIPNLVSAWILSQRSQNTATAYRQDIAMWLEWCEKSGVEDPLTIRRAHVDTWARWMERTPHGRWNRPAALSTVNRRIASVSSFYDYCVQEEVLDVNRVKSVRRHRMSPEHSETFTPSVDEARRILAETRRRGARAWAYTLVMACAGLRVTEVVAADVSSLRTVEGVRGLRVVAKGNKTKHVPLPRVALDAGDEYLDGRRAGPIFLGRNGERLTRQAVSNEIASIGEAAGCPLLTPHSYRHLFATVAVLTGSKKDDIQKFLGHSDGRTTDIYIALNDHFDRHPGEKIAAKLLELDKEPVHE